MNVLGEFMISSEVKIGRLWKKINKLQLQRDHYRREYETLKKVLDTFPFIHKTYDDYKTRIANAKRLKELEERTKEQALIIKKFNEE